YGLRGFNIYMAVERDRWIGAPIDQRGYARPSAAFFRRLDDALEKIAFHTLVRPLPVRIVAPAIHRRLRRILFAFTPTTPPLFALTGAGAQESCFEDDLGHAGPELSAIEAFARLVEERLCAHGVHFGQAEGAAAPASLAGARFVFCPSSGSID